MSNGNGENTGCGTIIAILVGIGLVVSIITSIIADINFLDMLF